MYCTSPNHLPIVNTNCLLVLTTTVIQILIAFSIPSPVCEKTTMSSSRQNILSCTQPSFNLLIFQALSSEHVPPPDWCGMAACLECPWVLLLGRWGLCGIKIMYYIGISNSITSTHSQTSIKQNASVGGNTRWKTLNFIWIWKNEKFTQLRVILLKCQLKSTALLTHISPLILNNSLLYNTVDQILISFWPESSKIQSFLGFIYCKAQSTCEIWS